MPSDHPTIAAAEHLAVVLNDLTAKGYTLRWVVEAEGDHIAGVEVSRLGGAPLVWQADDETWSVR